MNIEDEIASELSPYVGEHRLNAACGQSKYPGWVNLDKYEHQNPDVLANLDEILPFNPSTFDTILCSHTLEHVVDPMFTVYEFYRILKVGGYLIIVVPHAFGDIGLSMPQHRSYFTPSTFQCFIRSYYEAGPGRGAHQGSPVGDWVIEKVEMVPYPKFVGHVQLDFLANHCFNIIRELRAVLRRVS